MSPLGSRLRAFLCLAVLAGVAAWSLPRLEARSDITHFLPSADDRRLAELAEALTSSELNRTLTVLVDGPSPESVVPAARDLAARLESMREVAWVRAGPDPALQQAFYEAYFPHRLGLVAPRPEEVQEALSAEGLRARLGALRERLASPTGTFVRRIATEDPWLAFLGHLERLQEAQQGELRVREGQFVVNEGRTAVVLLASEDSPFDGEATRALLNGLEGAFAAVRETHPEMTFRQAGVHRLAATSEATIRADITRVSSAGTLAVIVLLLLLFRSARVLLLGGLPLVGGLIVATASCQLLFGSLHGLTLAFGATLIGVAIDYVAHLLNHHFLAPRETPGATLRHIAPGLLLGCATTVAGLAGLAWTSFPGIREMAVFTSVGVATALGLTAVLLPPFLPAQPRATRLHRALEALVGRALGALARHRRALWALPAGALLLAAIGLPSLRWDDDIRSLSALDPELMAEDERVRAEVARLDTGRLVVARGDTLEEALRRNDAASDALHAAIAAGELERFRSLAPLLPSAARQEEVHAAIDAGAWERTEQALRDEGFVPELFAPFREALAAPFEALRWEDLAGSPLEPLARSFRIDEAEGVALLTYLRGADAEGVRERVEAIEGVRFFDQSALMQAAYGTFRTRTLELVAMGLLAVFLLIFLRYRHLGRALAAFVPAVAAGGVTLAALAIAGEPANLLHVVTLLLVLSMGVDYGVFVVESSRSGDEEDVRATVVSIVIACLSTMLSFGVLAMSASPAMRAMGMTAAVGVGVSLLLAPSAWLLTGRVQGEGE